MSTPTATGDRHEYRRGSLASELRAPRERPRLIAVGVRDVDHDNDTIAWVAREAVPAIDRVLMAHAYEPVTLTGCNWEPIARAREDRTTSAQHVAAQAAQRAHVRETGVQLEAAAIAGRPEDVFVELSEIVDLLVIGDSATVARQHPHIAQHIRSNARCPVVTVTRGNQPRAGLPVTVVLDELELPHPVLEFAADAAFRRGVALHVSRAWRVYGCTDTFSAESLAEQQEELDIQLAPLAEEFDLPIVSRIELGDGWMRELRDMSSVVVTGQHSGLFAAAHPEATSPGCPTVVVPDHGRGQGHARTARPGQHGVFQET
jgi:hypothetical protein